MVVFNSHDVVTEHLIFKREFTEGLIEAMQQRKSHLRDSCQQKTVTGEATYFDYIDSIEITKAIKGSDYLVHANEAERNKAVNQFSTFSNPRHTRRECIAHRWPHGMLIDDFDEIRAGVKFQDKYITDAKMAYNRLYDKTIIRGLFNPVQYGGIHTQGHFSVMNDTHLLFCTPDKIFDALLELNARFTDYFVDDSETNVVIDGSFKSLLLKSDKVTSRDFNPDYTLGDGRVTRFLGFNFINIDRRFIPNGAIALTNSDNSVTKKAYVIPDAQHTLLKGDIWEEHVDTLKEALGWDEMKKVYTKIKNKEDYIPVKFYPVFVKNSIIFASLRPITVKISEDPSIDFKTRLHLSEDFGTMRIHDKCVGFIGVLPEGINQMRVEKIIGFGSPIYNIENHKTPEVHTLEKDSIII